MRTPPHLPHCPLSFFPFPSVLIFSIRPVCLCEFALYRKSRQSKSNPYLGCCLHSAWCTDLQVTSSVSLLECSERTDVTPHKQDKDQTDLILTHIWVLTKVSLLLRCFTFLSECSNMWLFGGVVSLSVHRHNRTNNNTDRYTADYREIDRRPPHPDKMDMGGSEEQIWMRGGGGGGVACVMAGVGQWSGEALMPPLITTGD